jgi:tetratricopeptide (TPR) repeat protein
MPSLKRGSAIVGTAGLAIQLAPHFGFTATLMSLPAFIAAVLASWFGIEWIAAVTKRPLEAPPPAVQPGTVVDAMLADIQRHYAAGHQYAILRLRESFSRYLWLEGRHSERITLGMAADTAAAVIGDKRAQIAALVDDLGWTLVAERQYVMATRHLEHGLKLATEAKEHYWIAKGYRHLAGIAILQSDLTKAEELLAKSTAAAADIQDVKQRAEMLAGIQYAVATAALVKGDTAGAEAAARLSAEDRKTAGDPTRLVRMYALFAKIALAKDDYSEAKDLFRKGLATAEAIGRRDEQIRNHLGLSRVYKHDNDFEQAKYHKDKAELLLRDTPVPYEIIDNI